MFEFCRQILQTLHPLSADASHQQLPETLQLYAHGHQVSKIDARIAPSEFTNNVTLSRRVTHYDVI